jgi:hypothetical protein
MQYGKYPQSATHRYAMSTAMPAGNAPARPLAPPRGAGWMVLAPGEESWLGLIASLGAGLCPELFDLGDLHRQD